MSPSGLDEPPATLREPPAAELDSSPGWLGFTLPDPSASTFVLALLLILSLAALILVSRLRRPLPQRGVVPRALRVAHLLLRLTVIALVLAVATRLLPDWLQPALAYAVVAVAVAVGFGATWLLLPDVIAGVVLVTEDRFRPGCWVSGDGFAGAVLRRGLRATLLRGADGALVVVPNTAVMRGTVRVAKRRWYELETCLLAPPAPSSSALRGAIRDAILGSPYVPPEPELSLSRDPADPDRWRIKVRLLDASYAAPFEDQLLERVEEELLARR